MKEIKVSVNTWYVVEGTAGATVINPSTNKAIATVEDGKQTAFYATTPYVLVSDDSVNVFKATFNSAPAKLRLLGLLGGGASTVKKLTLEEALALASLPDGGGKMSVSLPWDAQFADTGVPDALQIAADKGWVIKVQYRDGAESERYSRYAAFTTDDEIKAAYPDYKNDLTTDGGWIYPLSSLAKHADFFFQNCKAKYAYFDIPKINTSSRFAYGSSIEEYVINAPRLSGGYAFLGNYAVKVTGYFPNVTNGSWLFAGESVKEFYADFPKLQTATGMFSYTQLNKASVLQILGSLPSYSSGSHPLTIGIHVDHKTDEEVAAAIADAEVKGWTVMEQWNGTATAQAASTFGLRRPAIYAKVGTMELPDGTTEQYLDWGHYVTNWTENGYVEFASVEEAKEYFNVEN